MSLKIFGIAVTLLLLMIIVTLVSSINLHRMGQELHLLTDFYIKLDQAMGDIRTQSLREIILIERVMHNPRKSYDIVENGTIASKAEEFFREAGDCEPDSLSPILRKVRQAYPDRVEQQLMVYQVTRRCTQARLEYANALVNQMLAQPQIKSAPDKLMRLTTIKADLANILPARERLHTSFEKYLKQKQAGDTVTAAFIQENLDENRRDVSRRTGAISRSLHAGTRESADLARKLESRTLWLGWMITLFACALGLVVAGIITRNLVRPVLQLLSLTKAIQKGNLDVNIQIKTADEIGELADSFSHMVEELRQKELIKKIFGKYVDPRIVQILIHERQQIEQSGERQVMSVFFSDMEGFTAICEGLTPSAIVRLLNRYFTLMAEPIKAQQGIIDKYIGDSVMAFWGPPFISSGEHARLACLAALDQQAMLPRFHSLLPEIIGTKHVPMIGVRMGIVTGDVIVGSIGSEDARSYTVIGDTVNLASRIESANKHYRTKILLCEKTRTLAGDAIEAREIDAIRVFGKTDPVRIYELIARKGDISRNTSELRTLYEHGLARYRERKWGEAFDAFSNCLKIDPNDGPSLLFIERISVLRTQKLPENWDGIWTFTDKNTARHE